MGVNDKDILDYLQSKGNGIGELAELWDLLKNKPDITLDWVINDIENLEKDGLLTFDTNTGTITLLPKANRPVARMLPDVNK